MPSTSEKASRRKPIHSSWSLAVLMTVVCGMALLPSSLVGRAARRRSRVYELMLGSDAEKIRVARYGEDDGPDRPGRIFRNNCEGCHATTPARDERIYGPTSQYERLWPGYRLPNWARKVPRFRHFRPPKGNSMCFVHVGKTAGSSIGCALGFQLHCEDASFEGGRQYLSGRLPKSVTNAFHKDVYDCPDDTDLYLLVVRDPLARVRSAFVYGRPDKYGHTAEGKYMDKINDFYVNCPFSRASSLASSGLAEDGDASSECKQRAKDALRGYERYEDHIFFNYQYYLESIPHGSNIVVIRTEHMEEDWNSIELGFGGKYRTNITFPHDNARPKDPRDLTLSDDERALLCHELCVEIQTYKLILRDALNINEGQYNASMAELQESCPTEAALRQCDFHTPNIKEKLKANRGYPKPVRKNRQKRRDARRSD